LKNGKFLGEKSHEKGTTTSHVYLDGADELGRRPTENGGLKSGGKGGENKNRKGQASDTSGCTVIKKTGG